MALGRRQIHFITLNFTLSDFVITSTRHENLLATHPPHTLARLGWRSVTRRYRVYPEPWSGATQSISDGNNIIVTIVVDFRKIQQK